MPAVQLHSHRAASAFSGCYVTCVTTLTDPGGQLPGGCSSSAGSTRQRGPCSSSGWRPRHFQEVDQQRGQGTEAQGQAAVHAHARGPHGE
jgi:hypothetical protein